MLHFLREEVLDGPNAYKCDKCNKKTRATKKYSIKTAPNILVVHLKRFDFSYAGKLSHYVQYPEFLSLKTFIHDPDVSPTSSFASSQPLSSAEKALRGLNYKLYGVLVHLGHTSHSGHYYSYVRGSNDNWYKADDQRVSVVASRDALAQNAYILFYTKMSASPSPNPDSIQPIQQLQQQNTNSSFSHSQSTYSHPSTLMSKPILNTNCRNLPYLLKESDGDSSRSSSCSSSSTSLNSSFKSAQGSLSSCVNKFDLEKKSLKLKRKIEKKRLKRLMKLKLKNSNDY